jgi:predicted CXXCH cytochrome family protein
MRIVLRRIELLGGLDVATDEPFEADRVTLGRGTDQNVQLPDMRVTLAHAEIRRQAGGGYRIECRGDNPVWVNGAQTVNAVVGVGDAIDIGRFRITIGAPEPEQDLVLLIEEHVSTREEKGRRRSEHRMMLDQTGLSKRRWAWGLAAAMLAGLLVVPLAARLAGGDQGRSLDAMWQSGPPIDSPFVHACAKCHETPFARVKNDACLACHKAQPLHSDRREILALPGMDDARCASCHEEHTGRNALIARKPELCTDCHAEPDARYAAAELPPVHRFDGDHPDFTLRLLAVKDGVPGPREVRQVPGAELSEESNLIFPHDKHLLAKGVNAPEGVRVMKCADCHKPAALGFTPVRMETQCADCHRLAFDPDNPDRVLPHGQPKEVAALIRDRLARDALGGGVAKPDAPEIVRLLRRPGQVLTRDEAQAALAWADAQAERMIDDVFSRRICTVCHVVGRTEDPAEPWTVAKVRIAETYLSGARFDHRAHASEECSRCHEATTSKASTEVLIPPLANCRECHGDPGVSGRMATACVDCHGFHIGTTMTFAPAPSAPSP